MKKILSGIAIAAVSGFFASVGSVNVASAATSLDQLLEEVRIGRESERRKNAQREAEFSKARDQQKNLLRRARNTLKKEEDRSTRLENDFKNNEIRLAQLENLLTEKLGDLGELFGIVRQVAGDTRGQVEASLISAQFPGRAAFLGELAQSKELPTIQQLRDLWYAIQMEMTESAKVSRFRTSVITVDGKEASREVVRIGTFNAISNGQYLRYDAELGKLAELGRQPAGRYLSIAEDFGETQSGIAEMAIDPSRGSILSLLVLTPSLRERVDQGGTVGYAIIVLAIFGLMLAVWRLFQLSVVASKVNAQMRTETADEDNPLGRVLIAYHNNREADVETLELKLDEAILQEMPDLERGLSTIKVLSAVAPLMGLLGTVTGMIETFQAITLFGTGDPKLMAGGISQALVTTVLGLLTAIPLVLLHTVVSGRSKSVTHILEEQSAGMIATHAERRAAGG